MLGTGRLKYCERVMFCQQCVPLHPDLHFILPNLEAITMRPTVGVGPPIFALQLNSLQAHIYTSDETGRSYITLILSYSLSNVIVVGKNKMSNFLDI